MAFSYISTSPQAFLHITLIAYLYNRHCTVFVSLNLKAALRRPLGGSSLHHNSLLSAFRITRYTIFCIKHSTSNGLFLNFLTRSQMSAVYNWLLRLPEVPHFIECGSNSRLSSWNWGICLWIERANYFQCQCKVISYYSLVLS